MGLTWIDVICCALLGVDTPPDCAIFVDVMGWQEKRDSSAQGFMSALLDNGMTRPIQFPRGNGNNFSVSLWKQKHFSVSLA